jgi:hypothetical protein
MHGPLVYTKHRNGSGRGIMWAVNRYERLTALLAVRGRLGTDEVAAELGVRPRVKLVVTGGVANPKSYQLAASPSLGHRVSLTGAP